VADVTIQDPRTLILTGKSYGQTNMIVLDAKGNPIADTLVEVIQAQADLVTMFSAGARSTVACAPNCAPVVMVGDSPTYTQELTSSMGLVQGIAAQYPVRNSGHSLPTGEAPTRWVGASFPIAPTNVAFAPPARAAAEPRPLARRQPYRRLVAIRRRGSTSN
jgi:hypothetical protein